MERVPKKKKKMNFMYAIKKLSDEYGFFLIFRTQSTTHMDKEMYRFHKINKII